MGVEVTVVLTYLVPDGNFRVCTKHPSSGTLPSSSMPGVLEASRPEADPRRRLFFKGCQMRRDRQRIFCTTLKPARRAKYVPSGDSDCLCSGRFRRDRRRGRINLPFLLHRSRSLHRRRVFRLIAYKCALPPQRRRSEFSSLRTRARSARAGPRNPRCSSGQSRDPDRRTFALHRSPIPRFSVDAHTTCVQAIAGACRRQGDRRGGALQGRQLIWTLAGPGMSEMGKEFFP